MPLYAQSSGILARHKTLTACLAHSIEKYTQKTKVTQADAVIGWGTKPASLKLKQQAISKGQAFWHLEDGFIGYIGHPAKGGINLSIIADPIGIYYHSQQPSTLEQLIPQTKSPALLQRAKQVIDQVQQFGITKYNCYPQYQAHKQLPPALAHQLQGRAFILLVDQVAGDQSLCGAQANSDHFLFMLQQAKQQYPDTCLVIRSHPDTRFGKKSGVLSQLKNKYAHLFTHVIWSDEACHPHSLINHCLALFTVSSQMGFEALILGKPVHCFGLPFYAGWGLTHDSNRHNDDPSHHRRQKQHNAPITLAELVAACLIEYPRYCNPITGKRCEIEEVIELLKLQHHPRAEYNTLWLLGFSMWKKAFIPAFCRHIAKETKFVKQLPKQLPPNSQVAVWGNRYPELDKVIRIEDGFIRSSGLGSNLSRPASLVLDPHGMYFNAQQNNALKQLLRDTQYSDDMVARGSNLIALLRATDVSKYNLQSLATYQPVKTDKTKLLVVGQVDGDASIVTGSHTITSNEALLWAVRQFAPEAYIIYKPHPDVIAGNRPGKISALCKQQCIDEYVTEHTLSSLYPHIDALHTITSLSGFEALLRDIPVVTWGQPFYAGWGLTQDQFPADDRNRRLTLPQLVYSSVVQYPLYIDWDTGLFTQPEWLIEKLANQKAIAAQQQSRLQRWKLKLTYLFATLRQTN